MPSTDCGRSRRLVVDFPTRLYRISDSKPAGKGEDSRRRVELGGLIRKLGLILVWEVSAAIDSATGALSGAVRAEWLEGQRQL